MTDIIYCGCCSQGFSSTQYFVQHVLSKEKTQCFDYFFCGKVSNDGLRRHTIRSRLAQKREYSAEAIEQVLQEEIEVERQRKLLRSGDFSVFDFVDDHGKKGSFGIQVRSDGKRIARASIQGGTKNESTTNKEEPAIRDDKAFTMPDEEENTPNFGAATGNNGYDTPNNGALKVDQGSDANRASNLGNMGAPNLFEGPAVVNEDGLHTFKQYVEMARHEYQRFTPEMKAAIELMHVMNQKGGSLTLYEEIFQWHIRNLKAEEKVTAEALHKELVLRYNMEETLPMEVSTYLPHERTTIKLAVHDILAASMDLLSDPRLEDHHYLFYDDDPTAGPPPEFTTVGDINTGRAMRETYRKLIQPNPRTPCGRIRVPLAYIFYLDGCTTGQFQNNTLEILKFTLGILNRKCREMQWAWRNAGCIKRVIQRKNLAKRIIKGSSHLDSQKILKDDKYHQRGATQKVGDTRGFDATLYDTDTDTSLDENYNPRQRGRKRPPRVKPQDFMCMLQTILSSYKEKIQDPGGFPWDLRYQGKTYCLFFVPFILFVKADGKEGDKMCGAYQSKTEHVQCLCRFCTCPTCDTDKVYPWDSQFVPVMKTQHLIQPLVTAGDLEVLKSISQQCVWNPWYEILFGLHNNSGIHGAINIEPLHWTYLGTYKYDRANFFDQTGPDSILSNNLDAVAQAYGFPLKRQSNRDVPRTQFSNVVKDGIVMAHEMQGIILVLVLTLRSTKGRHYILDTALGDQKMYFPDEKPLNNWIRLLELHLMFDRWMQQEEFNVAMVELAKTKVLEIMAMTKYVGRRSKGMQFKTANFHGMKHVCDAILDFGSPKNVDTRSDEMHHKPDKKTAQRTTKHLDTFDIEVSKKIVQRRAVDLGMAEINDPYGRKKWHYYRRKPLLPTSPLSEKDKLPVLSGPSAVFYRMNGAEELQFKVNSRMQGKEKYVYDVSTSTAISELANGLELNEVSVFGHLKVFLNTDDKKASIFHATPYEEGHPWNDFGVFNLSKPTSPTERSFVVAQIKCFIDFRELQMDNNFCWEPGIYCIIEPMIRSEDAFDARRSLLFELWLKTPSTLIEISDLHCKAQCVHIKHLRMTATVVPDFDNPNSRAYLRMVPMNEWPLMFEDWLQEPPNENAWPEIDTDSDVDPTEQEYQEEDILEEDTSFEYAVSDTSDTE
jgi:hypothetical protein